MNNDPSRSSHYVSDAFYARLVDDFSDWQRDDRESLDPGLRESCRRLLEQEARLLDEGRFEDWLALYAPECLYWVPATPEAGDPRREVAVAFDDRRRLEDRLYRVGTGFAWSQTPPSRTVRMVSNVQVFDTADESVSMVRSNVMINEFRAGETRLWSGWVGHRLRWRDARWEILVKQVNLINGDQNLRNPSIIF